MVQENDPGKYIFSRALYFSNISTYLRLPLFFPVGAYIFKTDYTCSLLRVMQIHFSAKCFAQPGSGGVLLLDYQQVRRMDFNDHFLSGDLSYGVFKVASIMT